ncbi:GNAT family N-acetyltransferase [Bacteroides sp. 519]|uniref:GNAT family N-acetyltransferase n=1 Tax=Bacteroides sp. 519 TaxID=2302937 RepID=UPI0013D5DC2E|nr:GNAT family N-acetyltransferase [Bacteroides sp. 519]NDV57261.1 GNAT family N-acetyltransferase [Bacteroides sp. 519]
MTVKNRVKELWKLCFNDSEEFIELYFGLRYTNKINVSIQSGDNMIAALQMIPYPMTFCGTEISTSYISGACTHPEYRGKGVMRELLSQSFAQMTRKGVYVSTLIPAEPWLFDYYAKAGYVPVFHYSEKEVGIKEVNIPDSITIKHACSPDEASYAYFDQKMHERSCCIQHEQDDYNVILEDLKLAGGTVFTAWENNNIIGMAFVIPESKTLKVKEILCNNTDLENILIQQAAIHYNSDKIVVVHPADAEGKPKGMARIIYAKAVLQLFAATHPDKELNIELTDDQLSLNNGYYYLVNGKCMTTRKRIPGSHLQLTIGELTKLLFSYTEPYMSLMLE